MRLIDADKLKHDVLDWEACYNGFSDAYDKARIIDAIDEQPTVDAEPVRHGKWIKGEKIYPDMLNDSTYGYWCSERHHIDVHGDNVEVLYCWHCGAKMDETK